MQKNAQLLPFKASRTLSTSSKSIVYWYFLRYTWVQGQKFEPFRSKNPNTENWSLETQNFNHFWSNFAIFCLTQNAREIRPSRRFQVINDIWSQNQAGRLSFGYPTFVRSGIARRDRISKNSMPTPFLTASSCIATSCEIECCNSGINLSSSKARIWPEPRATWTPSRVR